VDAGILKTAGQVAGIGGLSIGLLILIFRPLIQRIIFKGWPHDYSYSIIKYVIGASWSVAIVGLAAWTYVEAPQKLPIPDYRPVTIWPVVDLNIPIEQQLQLFATDRVKIHAGDNQLQKVWFGGEKNNWFTYAFGKEYIVQGQRGVPVTPRFEGRGVFKLEVEATNERDKKRDLR
jgi:hypothetical protein